MPKILKLKPILISIILNGCQFGGLSHEDLNIHIAMILQLCDTLKINEVIDDAGFVMYETN